MGAVKWVPKIGLRGGGIITLVFLWLCKPACCVSTEGATLQVANVCPHLGDSRSGIASPDFVARSRREQETQTICCRLCSGAPGQPHCLASPANICHSTALKSLLWGLLARILSPYLLLQGLAWEATQSHSSGAGLQGPHHSRIWLIHTWSGHDSIWLTLFKIWYRTPYSQTHLEWRKMTLNSWPSLPAEFWDYRHPPPCLPRD